MKTNVPLKTKKSEHNTSAEHSRIIRDLPVKSFSKIASKFEELGFEKVEVPNLIQAQIDSYNTFLQRDIRSGDREDQGLQQVFKSIFPITDSKQNYSLDFIDYIIVKEKYDTEECIERNLTFSASIRAKMRLVIYDEKALKDYGEKKEKHLVEQDVYLGDIPLITNQGTFIINGAERVIISQLHRSPGVFLTEDSSTGGKLIFSAKIIPYKGSWIEFTCDANDILFVYIDNRRKIPVTTFLRCLGEEYSSDDDLRKILVQKEEIPLSKSLGRILSDDLIFLDESSDPTEVLLKNALGKTLKSDLKLSAKDDDSEYETISTNKAMGRKLIENITIKVLDQEEGLIIPANQNLTESDISVLKKAKISKVNVYIESDSISISMPKNNSDSISISKNIEVIPARTKLSEELINKLSEVKITKVYVFQEEKIPAKTQITDEIIKQIEAHKIEKVVVIASESETMDRLLDNTIEKDTSKNTGEAAKKIYGLHKPNEDVTNEVALDFFWKIFFDEKRYSLGEVGRYKINNRLNINKSLDTLVLTADDIVAVIKKLVDVYKDEDEVDDIDHLANRRIRTIGELLEEQYSIGLSRVARIATERLTIANSDEVTVHEIINPNALTAVVNSFFLTGQLSQFMEQTNPLAAIKHKRALSALGPGGISRDRAGFDVRDVHYSHFGRICPIETPEGPNIGLIVSPSLFSRLNKYGFLETPYIKIDRGKVTSEIHYLDPLEEDQYTIAQANANIDKNRKLVDDLILARKRHDYIQARPADVEYMDVAPQQIVSVSAALIPFLEHDDANRALMGSNMQRQSVPLLYPEAPIVGTGLEKIVVRDAGICAVAPYDGLVVNITSSYIDIMPNTRLMDKIELNTSNRIYLKKFLRSNQDTCINQKPVVKKGELVKAGQIISDGPCIENGRLALGRNLVVAFMPWYGYNYEDAIILSEKVAHEDILTSVYIEVHEVKVRNTKNGKEELARDIPNVPNSNIRNLDSTGIIRVGSAILTNDVIVGKITPKSVDVDPSPEETLMRALFGDRAGDYTNSSLKAKPGMEGVVIDVKVFSRYEDNVDYEEERKEDINRIKREYEEHLRHIEDFKKQKLTELLEGEIAKSILDDKGQPFIAPGKKIAKDDLKKINFKKLNLDLELVKSQDKNKTIYYEVVQKVKVAIEESDNINRKKKERLKHGDELEYGVLKMVKVYIAKKRKIQVGDKMAGRHGNKGIISKICPLEDMPFTADGTPVDIILNPLGVPSRMNIGQIMETHLGMAAKTLGYMVETPVFDGAEPSEIAAELEKANLPPDGKQLLYDGKTGEPFRERVTVGVIYMMKLNHLVADKMHARSTGPYSLITQQPLGGKAQNGGQRLGEMEVWALEAYGAAGLLAEMLTIKSDDVEGRTEAYKAITSGQNVPKPGTPESFNVLISELNSLCFDIDFYKESDLQEV